MNWWHYFLTLLGLVPAFEAVKSSIDAGIPVATPPVRTYIDGHHVEIVMQINPVA